MDSIRVSEAPDPGSIPGEATKNISMFFTYVLKSIAHDYFYKGHCKDLTRRLKQHNSGMTKSLRFYIPFEIVYFEQFSNEKEAMEREK